MFVQCIVLEIASLTMIPPPLLPPAGQCGHVKFNLSVISADEFVVKARLRVHVNTNGASNVRAYLKHKNNSRIVDVPVTAGWVEFSLNNVIAAFARNRAGPKLHELIVELQSGDTVLNCENRIITNTADRNQQPSLVVYSYQPNVDDIPIIKGLRRSMPNITKRSVQPLRSRRSTLRPLDGACRRHDVSIQINWLNERVVTDGKLIHPNNYNAGICGGDCSRTVPMAPEHAVIFHLVSNTIGQLPARLRNSDKYEKCCVPVEYDHENFVIQKGGVLEAWKLNNASAKRCGCVYYRKYA